MAAQRLGLEAHASDLNPVAVLINRAMIEIPSRFKNQPPVNIKAIKSVREAPHKKLTTWQKAQGLAADIAAYGEWMHDEAKRRIGHLYPDVAGPDDEKLTTVAWIWARTVPSPDPAWGGPVPLVKSWTLRSKPGKPRVWVEPVVDRHSKTIRYEVHEGGEPNSSGSMARRGHATCVATGAAIPNSYIKYQGREGVLGSQLIAVVAQGDRQKCYFSPDAAHVRTSECEWPSDVPTDMMSTHPQYMGPPKYGLTRWNDIFTPRQLVALTTFSDLLKEVHTRIRHDAVKAGLADDGVALRAGGCGALAYADAITTYLALVIDRCAGRWSSTCTWQKLAEKIGNIFSRFAVSMTWDFAEANPFNGLASSWLSMLRGLCKSVNRLPVGKVGVVAQGDARVRVQQCPGLVVSTDPPYYDAVPYAAISDFFYVWLRRNLKDIWPDECATLLTPKSDELIADSCRAGSKEQANDHFEGGLSEFMSLLAAGHPREVPATIYYAYKATGTGSDTSQSTGWSTFLQAVIDGGLQVTATWPVRTERTSRMRANKSNALASSIVLSCRPRSELASLATRGEFIAALRDELPRRVAVLQEENIPPVDLAQAAIGPGIEVFSRYSRVVESDGTNMAVTDALVIVNDALGEILDGEEAELDAATRFALTWYSQHGYRPADSGDADVLAKAKNTDLVSIQSAGIGKAIAGEFQLFERSELDPEWFPHLSDRFAVWQAAQHLISRLEASEDSAAELLHQLGQGLGERARQLTYALYKKASEKGWNNDALAYNGLIMAWPALESQASTISQSTPQQDTLGI